MQAKRERCSDLNNGGYLTSLTNKINGTASEIYSYQYDLAGNRLSESKLYNGTNSTTSYTYDNVNRLKTVTEPDGGTISYDFDKSGNIAAKTMTHPSDYVFRYSENGTEYTMHDIFLHNILYTYNKNNELLREQNSAAGTGDVVSGLKQSFTYYTYDSNGNTLSRSNDIYTESYTYDMLNRLKAYTDAEDTVTNYVYDAVGKRVSKQTGSSATEFNWDGDYCVLEKTNGLTSAKNYIGIYGVFARSSSGEVTSFLKNGHGDVSALVSDGQIVKTYAYDPYGQEKNPVSTDTNPFRYCGEYYDAETGNIYLRNRYYNPANGRFISEDPAKSGKNWYAYCSNGPINKIDPLGLFDYNTRLSYSQTYNEDVEVLQNELAWLGYLDMSDGGWGYYGPKTQAAVNAYKNDMGLGNTGKDKGVVGLQTWTSLGLIYRAQDDINAGVKISTIGRKQYFDISKAVNDAVYNAKSEFAQHSGDFRWFRAIVGDAGKWNIKRNSETWASTLGISKNSYCKAMLFYGRIVQIDDVGNITYGYLGKAAGFPDATLMAGSMGNHIKNHVLSDFDNEMTDEEYIRLGISWYNGSKTIGDVHFLASFY